MHSGRPSKADAETIVPGERHIKLCKHDPVRILHSQVPHQVTRFAA